MRELELAEQKQLNLARKPKQRLRKVKKDLELERKEWADATAALKSEVAQLRNETKSLKHLASATEMTPDEQIAVARVSEQPLSPTLTPTLTPTPAPTLSLPSPITLTLALTLTLTR